MGSLICRHKKLNHCLWQKIDFALRILCCIEIDSFLVWCSKYQSTRKPPSDSFHLLQFSVCYHTSNAAAAAQCSQHQKWIQNLGKGIGNSLTLYIHLDDTACQTLQRRKIALKTTSEMWVALWWRTALDVMNISCLMISSYKVLIHVPHICGRVHSGLK